MPPLEDHLSFYFSKVQPLPDPESATAGGFPCPRGHHGLSFVTGDRLILYGGSVGASGDNGGDAVGAAAAPFLGDDEMCWALDLNGASDGSSESQQQQQQPGWRRIVCKSKSGDGPSSSCPPARIGHAQAADDKDGGKLYVFGGQDKDGRVLNDLWVLDCSGAAGSERWSQISFDGAQVEPRMYHKMVCVKQSLYIFGGYNSSKSFVELLRFDIAKKEWTNLGNPTKLSKLGGGEGCDFDDLLVLASTRKLGIVANGYTDGQRFKIVEQCWADKIEKLAKAQITATRSNEPNPSGQKRNITSSVVSASFPSADITIVLFGKGSSGEIVILDESRGNYLVTVTMPSALPSPLMRSCSACASRDLKGGRGVLYVFGGFSEASTGSNKQPFNDLWKLDVADEDDDTYLDLDDLRRAM